MVLEDLGSVRSPHHPQDVEEVGEGAGLSVTCLPQVQDVFSGARLTGKVIQVPAER